MRKLLTEEKNKKAILSERDLLDLSLCLIRDFLIFIKL